MAVEVIEINEVGTVTPVAPNQVDEYVQNGMKLIDERFGTNFLDQIDLDGLDIGSDLNCVCGQLFGSYSEGLNALELTNDQAYKYGFLSRRGVYSRLTEAWRNALLARSA